MIFRTKVAKIGDLCDGVAHVPTSQPAMTKSRRPTVRSYLTNVDLPVMGKACFLVRSTSLAPHTRSGILPAGRKYKQNAAESAESHTLGIDGFLHDKRLAATDNAQTGIPGI